MDNAAQKLCANFADQIVRGAITKIFYLGISCLVEDGEPQLM